MQYLVVAPPVIPPSEPPSGAFILAAGLAGHGHEVALLDLSVAFFEQMLADNSSDRPVQRELAYLRTNRSYDPERHRSATGAIHKRLVQWQARFAGWRLTLMDVEGPALPYDPRGIAATLERGPNPFEGLCEIHLDPVLDLNPKVTVLLSVAYLSQVPAAIHVVRHLRHRGASFLVGGSLPTSLAATGHGLEELTSVLGPVQVGDGSSLLSDKAKLLTKLAWPTLLAQAPYFSGRPIVPVPLSIGCPWSRCLFCPDRGMEYFNVPMDAVANLVETMPALMRARHPVLHLVDSAIPPAQLERLLPVTAGADLSFYGFARPTKALLKNDLLERAAAAGCLMLQLGVESGSRALLERYDKGVDPGEAKLVVRRAATAGIRTYLYLLFGLPAETDADREATLALLIEEAKFVDFLNLSLFNLPRFCELSERATEHDIIETDFPKDGGIRLYSPFCTSQGNPRQEAKQFLAQRLRVHPAVRAAILRTPRWLRAAHLALISLKDRQAP